MFTERKIEKFQQTISGLPDTPNLSAAELKRRFDACPEELRKALNGACDDGAALEKRMDAYRAETFEGEITRDMLAPAVREELSGKADADTNNTAHEAFSAQIAQKCEVYFGTYTGDGAENRLISLGFTPKAVLVFDSNGRTLCDRDYCGGLALPEHPVANGNLMVLKIEKNGFRVYYQYVSGNYSTYNTNGTDKQYYYIAFR